jgi:hypothetical protein
MCLKYFFHTKQCSELIAYFQFVRNDSLGFRFKKKKVRLPCSEQPGGYCWGFFVCFVFAGVLKTVEGIVV